MKKINGIVKIGVPSHPIHNNGSPCHQCYAEPDRRKTVRFFSETQMEIDLSRNIDGMLVTEVYDYLDSYCHNHKVICGGKEYTADDLFDILVDDDLTWDSKWKKKKVVKCSGCKYINNEISCANCRYRNIVVPDFDPTHGLEYLGW